MYPTAAAVVGLVVVVVVAVVVDGGGCEGEVVDDVVEIVDVADVVDADGAIAPVPVEDGDEGAGVGCNVFAVPWLSAIKDDDAETVVEDPGEGAVMRRWDRTRCAAATTAAAVAAERD